MGGIKAIAISHPHYYTTMTEWSRALGGVPIHLHEGDKKWIMRNGDMVKLWSGATMPLLPGLTLINAGGHYPGGTCLHWAAGAGGKGALLVRRHRAGGAGQQIGELHVELPEFHSAVGAARARRGRRAQAVRVRARARRVRQPHHLVRRQGRGGALGEAVS